MDKEKHESSNYVLQEEVHFGSVKIADDVVAMIAHLAASEVEGIHQMAGSAGSDLLSKVGLRSLAKGVRVAIDGDKVKADLAVIVDYGASIPTVSQKAQDKVKQTIESMTGLTVTDVNIRVAGVNVGRKA